MMRRAQAAMEYLMTYGWALLVIVLVLGALIYLQVLNPQARLQDTCNLPIGFKCDVAGLTGDGKLSVTIANQQAISLSMNVGCAIGTNTPDDKIDDALSEEEIQLSPGTSAEFTCDLNKINENSFVDKKLGEVASGEVFVKYTDGAAKYMKGTFTAKVSQLPS